MLRRRGLLGEKNPYIRIVFNRMPLPAGNDSVSFSGVREAPNGCVYFTSSSAFTAGAYNSPYRHVKYDPDTGTLTWLTPVGLLGTGYNLNFSNSVLAPNGKIYCVPRGFSRPNKYVDFAVRVFIIDPNDDTTSAIIGTESAQSDNELLEFSSGVLAPNGKIYTLPSQGRSVVLEIDPSTDTCELIPISGFNVKAGRSILAPNGKIYGIPYGNRILIKFDPATRAVTSPGTLTADYIRGGFLYPDGKIYNLSSWGDYLLILDTSKDTFQEIPAGVPVGGTAFNPFNFLNDGCLYVRFGTSGLIKFDPLTLRFTRMTFRIPVELTYYNGICSDGTSYYAPPTGTYLSLVSMRYNSKPLPGYMQMPSDLSQLATSEYNLYCNQ